MVDAVIIIAIMALVGFGAHIAQGEEMILHWLVKLWQRLPKWLHKPLWSCPSCTVSLWGVPAALLVAWRTPIDFDLWLIPVYLLAACGLSTYLNKDA